jgi:hypothetical protein
VKRVNKGVVGSINKQTDEQVNSMPQGFHFRTHRMKGWKLRKKTEVMHLQSQSL